MNYVMCVQCMAVEHKNAILRRRKDENVTC